MSSASAWGSHRSLSATLRLRKYDVSTIRGGELSGETLDFYLKLLEERNRHECEAQLPRPRVKVCQ